MKYTVFGYAQVLVKRVVEAKDERDAERQFSAFWGMGDIYDVSSEEITHIIPVDDN